MQTDAKVDAKKKRDALFKKSRPFVRPFSWELDFWVLWAAYDLGSFGSIPSGWSKEEFMDYVKKVISMHSSALVIEDDNKHFKNGRGPCAFVVIDNFGWRIEPHVDFFRWTSNRSKLRCEVAFLHMVKNSKDIGVCLVRSLKKTSAWFKKLANYGVLFPCGCIIGGDPRGDEYMFSVRGRRIWTAENTSKAAKSQDEHSERRAA